MASDGCGSIRIEVNLNFAVFMAILMRRRARRGGAIEIEMQSRVAIALTYVFPDGIDDLQYPISREGGKPQDQATWSP